MNKKQAEQQQRRADHTQQHAPLTAADRLSNHSTSTPSVPALLHPPKMPEPAKEIHAADLLKSNKVHSPHPPPPTKKPRAPHQQPTTTAPSHGNAQTLAAAKSVAIIEAQQQQIANQSKLLANQSKLLEIADRRTEEYERRLSLMEKARVISETRFADQAKLEECNETIIANLRKTKEDGREVIEALRMGYALQRERIRELELRAGGGCGKCGC